MTVTNKIPKQWYGEVPDKCEICSAPLTVAFVDGKTNTGHWANMCLICHDINGAKLGLGLGQKYVLDPSSGIWFKTGG